MRYVIALAVGIVGTLVLGAPAQAEAGHRVTLHAAAAPHAGESVVIRGKVSGKVGSVRIEKRAGNHWVLVRKAAVHHGAYAATVSRAATTTYLRAGTVGRYSAAGAVAPVSATATDACGAVLTKANGTPWTCTFDDEFNGTTLNKADWVPQTAFAMGTQAVHACARDNPANVNVAGGSLNLTTTKLTTPISCSFAGMSGPTSYASGGVTSHALFSQQYGRFEARIKNTATTFPGLQETFWLWPDDRVKQAALPWPFSGEMDISETYSSQPTLSIPFLHYNLSTALGVTTAWNCSAPRGQWNTYAAEWTATKVQIFVNGKSCLTNTSGTSAFLKPYILAFSEGLGAAGNVYDGRAPLGTMSVDYVKVWK